MGGCELRCMLLRCVAVCCSCCRGYVDATCICEATVLMSQCIRMCMHVHMCMLSSATNSRVAKTHRMPDVQRSFSVKEP